MPAYYQAADLFLLSSKVESSARVLTEALLAGLPAVTTASPGAEEAVEEERTGLIVPIGDRDAFAEAVLTLARDPERLREMARNTRARANEVVSPEALLEGLRKMYAGVVRT